MTGQGPAVRVQKQAREKVPAAPEADKIRADKAPEIAAAARVKANAAVAKDRDRDKDRDKDRVKK